MDVVELKKDLERIYRDISDADFNDKYQVKEIFFRLIRFSKNLIAELEHHVENGGLQN